MYITGHLIFIGHNTILNLRCLKCFIVGQNWTLEYDPNSSVEDPIGGNIIAVLIGNFPTHEVFWYPMLFGWLKAAEMIRNPFGNSKLRNNRPWNNRNQFNLNMFDVLEVEIWKASKCVETQNIIPIDF